MKRRAVPTFGLMAALLAASAVAGIAACGADNDAPPGAPTSATSSGTGGAGGADLDAGSGAGGLDEDAACASSTVLAHLRQLDMMVLLDRSGSMNQDGKWSAMTSALASFVADPASVGVRVGLQVFPNDPDGLSCDYHDYETPLVALGPLPAQEAALTAAIAAQVPAGNTPLYGAMKGVLLYAAAALGETPDHAVVVVLASDGMPGGCTETEDQITTIAELVSTAHGESGVATYAIGIAGADLAGLDTLAQAGGTSTAYDVTGDISQFAAKMAEIRGNALPCEVPLPAPPSGETLDPERVNVLFTPEGDADPTTLPHADGYGDCGLGAGWYYDDPLAPTKVVLCPASCTTVQTGASGELTVLFGCTTVLN